MSASTHIVVTLHCAGGFRSDVFVRLARTLPVESMNSGFSELVLVLPMSAVAAAKDFTAEAEQLRIANLAYKYLQIGVSSGVLPDQLPHPMPQKHPLVIEAFECGLESETFWPRIKLVQFALLSPIARPIPPRLRSVF